MTNNTFTQISFIPLEVVLHKISPPICTVVHNYVCVRVNTIVHVHVHVCIASTGKWKLLYVCMCVCIVGNFCGVFLAVLWSTLLRVFNFFLPSVTYVRHIPSKQTKFQFDRVKNEKNLLHTNFPSIMHSTKFPHVHTHVCTCKQN